MKNRILKRALTHFIVFLMLFSFSCIFAPSAHAAFTSVKIDGKVYSFDADANYEFSSSTTFEVTEARINTYGTLSIKGSFASDGSKNGVPSFLADSSTVELVYSYTDDLLKADAESRHLVDDSTKQVDEISLSSKVGFGALILQTSKDGVSWFNDLTLTNIFKDNPVSSDTFYSANSIQLVNGCYYRIVIAYKTGIKTGESKSLFGKLTDELDCKKTAEVYEFYLHNNDAIGRDDKSVVSKSLGTVTNTGKNNGYSGINKIDIKDPHYGWELGHFFVSGYTRETKDDTGTPVFLKNVGDQITLWFNLEQNIDKLNNDETLSIAEDTDGYDDYFQTRKTNLGQGALFVRYTDERGVKHEPEIYTSYLRANASTSADSIVRLFEEGDYEVALDYEIANTQRIIPDYTNYRIFFKFSVRNGNCMVYPFDVATGDELANEAITPNGFKLDMARSRYLTIDVTRSVVTEGPNGYTEDVRFNRPAKDGDSYTEPGIYVFSVKNLYTGESTTKTIYVGAEGYMKALSVNQMSVSDLNEMIGQGAIIEEDGTITIPKPEPELDPESKAETVNADDSGTEAENTSPAENPETEQSPDSNIEKTAEPEKKSAAIPIAIVSVFVVAAAFVVITRMKKKGKEE